MSNPITLVDKIERYESIKSFLSGLAPVRKVSCDIWADENIVLSSENSAEPGPWRTSRTPYLREILECLSPTNPAQRISFSKGVQIGATTAGIIAMLTYVDTDPAPIMYVLPTINMAEEFSKDKLQPMIDNSQSLAKKIRPAGEKGSGNTILGKRYPGGYIALAGANSAATLRMKSIRVLILDEVDAYPKNLDGEGSPISLAEKRTVSYTYKKKIFKLSTPTVLNASAITTEYEKTDQRKFHVPCPHCDEYQELLFARLFWKEGEPGAAVYRCEHCGEIIQERHKSRMLNRGKWVSTFPERRNDIEVGFHLSTMYSVWYKWVDIAAEYELAITEQKNNKDDNRLKTFTNTVLGEPYAEVGDVPDWEKLYLRREGYKKNIPNENCLILTAGIDVQHDRVELEIVGWGMDKRSWSVDYRVFRGKFSEEDVKSKIRELMDEEFTREDGLIMPIHKFCIDSSDQTTDVYEFCNSVDHDRMHPIKGVETQTFIYGAPVHVNRTPAGKAFGSLMRYNLGVSILKKELYNNLKKPLPEGDKIGPPGYCHFPEYPEDYFKGITAESQQTVLVNGYPKQKWIRNFQQNEPLDCRNYARAAMDISGYGAYKNDALILINKSYVKLKEPKKAKKKRVSEHW